MLSRRFSRMMLAHPVISGSPKRLRGSMMRLSSSPGGIEPRWVDHLRDLGKSVPSPKNQKPHAVPPYSPREKDQRTVASAKLDRFVFLVDPSTWGRSKSSSEDCRRRLGEAG